MASGMWFAVVKPDQPVHKKVKYGVSITQAVLDTENATEQDGITRVMMEVEEKNLVIANLSLKHGLLQTSLNLDFEQGDWIKISVPAGASPVHLFGCARVNSDDLLEEAAMRYKDLMEGVEDDDSDDDDEDIDEEEEKEIRKQLLLANKRKRKEHPLLDKSFPSDDESDNSYIPTEEDLKNDSQFQDLNLLVGDEDLDSDDDDDDDDEDDDEEMDEVEDEEGADEDYEDDEEDDEVPLPEPSKKKMKLMNGHAAATAEQQQKKKKEQKAPHSSGAKQPAGASSSGTPVQKKGDQPKSAKAQKKEKFDNKENEVKSTPKQDKKKQKGEKSPAAKLEGSARKTPKKMLSGGVMAEDTLLGSGPVVKKGNMVSVYYEGRLKSNNKLFDKVVSGPPFSFRVGCGEVIKGWDVGVAGMKVGGKRTLVIPPNMGYGKKGAAPSIPSNAALSFDVTVISAK